MEKKKVSELRCGQVFIHNNEMFRMSGDLVSENAGPYVHLIGWLRPNKEWYMSCHWYRQDIDRNTEVEVINLSFTSTLDGTVKPVLV